MCIYVPLCVVPVKTRKECQGSQRSDRGFGPHAGTGVTESCGSPCGY